MDNQVPEEIVKSRFEKLLALVQDISAEKTAQFVGETQGVLVEEVNAQEPGLVTGRTSQNYLVHFPGDASLIGQIVNVHLEESRGFYFMGNIVE